MWKNAKTIGTIFWPQSGNVLTLYAIWWLLILSHASFKEIQGCQFGPGTLLTLHSECSKTWSPQICEHLNIMIISDLWTSQYHDHLRFMNISISWSPQICKHLNIMIISDLWTSQYHDHLRFVNISISWSPLFYDHLTMFTFLWYLDNCFCSLISLGMFMTLLNMSTPNKNTIEAT